MSKAKPYHWFQGESVRELANRLQLAGPDTARLEVRTEGKKMLLRVVPHADSRAITATTDINDSRVCPPICS
jgi:hypothetical protein